MPRAPLASRAPGALRAFAAVAALAPLGPAAATLAAPAAPAGPGAEAVDAARPPRAPASALRGAASSTRAPLDAGEALNSTWAWPDADNATSLAGSGDGRAPEFTFYVYRALNGNSKKKYPFGNQNAANLPGVLWYLTNEVQLLSIGCNKRYGIDRIKRYRVTTRATPELFARGMNFGVRYSFDRGQCTGSNMRSELKHCHKTWDRYGYVVGCNKFTDHYPYPGRDTDYPEGIWYDFPLAGKCSSPTGERHCTWSAEEAGEIMLKDLEHSVPHQLWPCVSYWAERGTRAGNRRVKQAIALFHKKFPKSDANLPAVCDFNRAKWRA